MPPANRFGAQMFTLRDHCATPADIAASCQRVADMGYGGIQASAAGFNSIEAPELRKILDDTGLTCMATHRKLEELQDINAAVDYHKALGCDYTAIGGFGFGGASVEAWHAFCDEFRQLADKLAEKGLHLGYHNHSHELAPLAETPRRDAKRPYDIMVEKFAGSAVWFEVDTYWIAHGGADPVWWLNHLANTGGGIPCVHLKDISVTSEREHKMTEVGSGNLNWPEIVAALKKAGTKYFLIERDRGDLDPFESLDISFKQSQDLNLV